MPHLQACEAERAVVLMSEFSYLPADVCLELARRRLKTAPGAYGLVLMAPSITGELPAVAELAKSFGPERFAGYFLQPSHINVPEHPVFFKRDLSECERLQIPVFYRNGNSLGFLAEVMKAHPALPAVLAFDDEWPNTRRIYPIFDAFPSLRLCLSEFVWPGAIEEFVALFGSERLLYSSSFPARYPGGSMLMAQNADISDGDRENIFWKNLENLIGGMKV